jgi:hypothetical protein
MRLYKESSSRTQTLPQEGACSYEAEACLIRITTLNNLCNLKASHQCASQVFLPVT